MKKYKLTEDELYKKAVALTKIRSAITTKAERVGASSKQASICEDAVRSRKGLSYSKRPPEASGLTICEYQRWKKQEAFCTGKMKRRHLKDISATECFDVVYAAKSSKQSFKDVASRYHISPILVSRLVKDYDGNQDLFSKKRKKEEFE